MRCDLPVSDYGFREMATSFLDEIVQEIWESHKFQFRHSQFFISTGQGIEEYAMPKLSGGIQNVVPNTMRGSDPVRRIRYRPLHEYRKQNTAAIPSGDPFRFTEGQYQGFETQVSAASTISFVSSEANITAGTVSVVQGLKRMTLSSETLSARDLGKWIRVGSDYKRYKIVSIEPAAGGTSTVFHVHEEYDGSSNSTATYAIGDVQQKASVTGLLTNGAVAEEEVQLNGSTSVSTNRTFAQIIRITKSDKTHGAVTATSNGALITNIILDPSETEAEYQTLLFYPIPDKIELLSFWSYMKHPRIFKQNESPLFPSQFHNLLVIDLYIRLETEWKKQTVDQSVYSRRDGILDRMITWDNDTTNWEMLQETEETSERVYNTNLPNNYPDEY